jgi:hypothetical protein
VTAPAGGTMDDVVVKITRKRFWPFGNTTLARTDGSGFFGVAKVKPGRYTIAAEVRAGVWQKQDVTVAAGKVTRASF